MKENNNWFLRRLLYGGFIVLSTFYFGCSAKMVITPQMEPINNISEYKIKGKIVYDGNKEYLPRTLSDDLAAESLFTFNPTTAFIN